VTSYWTEDDTLQRRVFDAALDSNFVWAMGMLNKGKLRYFLQMGNTTTTRRYFEMYNMMGDGAIDIYWDIPATIQVNYPPVIPIGPYTIPVTVTKNGMPVKNALVCVMSTTDTSKQVSAYTDVNGQASLQITTNTPDSLSLVVTGHNLAPFFGGIQALPSAGAYVVYLRHTILDPSPGGNNDGIINPGESIEMRVWLKNVGNATANNVRAWLRTTDPKITVTDSFKNYGNIAGGDSAYILNGFKFTVAASCTNNHIIRFTLTIKDALDSTWRTNISLPVAQCDLIYLSTTVNDASGNNNGIINLGETVNLITSIKNIGNATANNINSILSSSTPGILVLDANGTYGSLLPNSTGTNQSDPYTIKADSTITPGTLAQFRIILTAGVYIETLYFSLPVEIYMQGFDITNGGYVPLPATGGWEWGVPTSGPNSAYSPPNVWATVLAGNYGVDNANWTLTTPELTAT
ncbi:MAG: Ig-like domain-containing protein, partial [candidate division WOR-3 bacterium]|nr:Ig-like domain-containing protein [candidate division WOR-3 bacterium]